MLTLERPTTAPRRARTHRTGRIARVVAQDRARIAALERLISVLEAGTPEPILTRTRLAANAGDTMNQLARLRAAHAAYALSTGSDMIRVSDGAWVRANL